MRKDCSSATAGAGPGLDSLAQSCCSCGMPCWPGGGGGCCCCCCCCCGDSCGLRRRPSCSMVLMRFTWPCGQGLLSARIHAAQLVQAALILLTGSAACNLFGAALLLPTAAVVHLPVLQHPSRPAAMPGCKLLHRPYCNGGVCLLPAQHARRVGTCVGLAEPSVTCGSVAALARRSSAASSAVMRSSTSSWRQQAVPSA